MSVTTLSILSLLIAGLLPMAIAFFLPRNNSFYKSSVVQGFGLGVYSALVILLLREGVEQGGVGNAVVWFAVGLVISIFIGIVLKEFHHHHTSEEKHHRHTRASVGRILVSDFFHNIVDGIAILAGFSISETVGLISLAGVMGHQMIQQAGQQILLVESGLSAKRALVISFFISLSLILGYFLRHAEALEYILIVFSAGIIAWKIGTDLLHVRWTKRTVLGFIIGAGLLTLALLLIPHGH